MEIWLQYKFLNLTLEDWLYTLLISLVSYLVLVNIWKFMVKKVTDISMRTATRFDDVLVEVMRSTSKITFALFSFLIGMHFLELSDKWLSRLDHLSFVVIGFQLGRWASKAVSIWAQNRMIAVDAAENTVITTMLSWIFKTLLWTIVLLSILANVGVNITAFVASLGVGGVAVALAVQNILSDLFASLAIGLDKPFVIGDFIIFGDVMGTVERVGLKTTHIRSLSGEQIVCSNTELLKNVIHNYKRMAERRVVFGFSITFDTPPEAVEKIPPIVKKIIQSDSRTRFDRAHFKGFGASSLDFEVVYFVLDSDFNIYMDIQQNINLALLKEMNALQVSFAFPTTTLDASRNPINIQVKSLPDDQQPKDKKTPRQAAPSSPISH